MSKKQQHCPFCKQQKPSYQPLDRCVDCFCDQVVWIDLVREVGLDNARLIWSKLGWKR